VLTPFSRGLANLLQGEKEPARLSAAVTDAYESLEAMAKIVTKSDVDLSANRERFIKQLPVSPEYRKLLKEYVDYGCRFRHAASDNRPKPNASTKEVESFVYLTGLLLRIAMPGPS
jgi:hypothetical protein